MERFQRPAGDAGPCVQADVAAFDWQHREHRPATRSIRHSRKTIYMTGQPIYTAVECRTREIPRCSCVRNELLQATLVPPVPPYQLHIRTPLKT